MGQESQSVFALWRGPLSDKQEFKKAIASMMVPWVAQTRRDLRGELIDNNPDGAWQGLNFSTVFQDEEEWRQFFSRVSGHFKNEEVLDAAKKTRILEILDAAEKAGMLSAAEEAEIQSAVEKTKIQDAAEKTNILADEFWFRVIRIPFCPQNVVINAMFAGAMDIVDKLWYEEPISRAAAS